MEKLYELEVTHFWRFGFTHLRNSLLWKFYCGKIKENFSNFIYRKVASTHNLLFLQTRMFSYPTTKGPSKSGHGHVSITVTTLRLHSSFSSCPCNVFYGQRIQLSISCYVVSLSLLQPERFLSPSLTFLSLLLLKVIERLFCRMPCSVGSSEVSPWLDSASESSAGIAQK